MTVRFHPHGGMCVRVPPTVTPARVGLESLWTREDVALHGIYAREAEGVCDRAASLTVRMFARRSVSWRRVVDRHV